MNAKPTNDFIAYIRSKKNRLNGSNFANMITDQEQLFINYWEANRDKQKKLFYQLAVGLPVGLVFALPVLLSVIFHDWYKQMTFISDSQVTIVLIAVLGITVFFSLFRMKFKWEENEQRYKELKFKQRKTSSTQL